MPVISLRQVKPFFFNKFSKLPILNFGFSNLFKGGNRFMHAAKDSEFCHALKNGEILANNGKSAHSGHAR